MWAAVRQRFSAFHADLKITQDQYEDGIRKALGTSNCLQRAYYPEGAPSDPAFLVGSWGKSTQVGPPSDLDMMFELPAEVYRRFNQRTGNVQSALLQEVKEHLGNTYSTSTIRGDGQVVQVLFNTVTVEIVPVFKLQSGQYYMPDTNYGGRWKTVDPRAEQRQIDELDKACTGNVRAHCQMFKLWKGEQNVRLKSFQIELLVQDFMKTYAFRSQDYFWYDWHVRDFFSYLVGKAGSFLLVPGTLDVVWLGDDWKSKAETAQKNALEACMWEHGDYDVTAGQVWRKIFGNRIPEKIL